MCWRGPFDVLAKVGECDNRIPVLGKEKVNHANVLKQYVERGLVDSTFHVRSLQQRLLG